MRKTSGRDEDEVERHPGVEAAAVHEHQQPGEDTRAAGRPGAPGGETPRPRGRRAATAPAPTLRREQQAAAGGRLPPQQGRHGVLVRNGQETGRGHSGHPVLEPPVGGVDLEGRDRLGQAHAREQLAGGKGPAADGAEKRHARIDPSKSKDVPAAGRDRPRCVIQIAYDSILAERRKCGGFRRRPVDDRRHPSAAVSSLARLFRQDADGRRLLLSRHRAVQEKRVAEPQPHQDRRRVAVADRAGELSLPPDDRRGRHRRHRQLEAQAPAGPGHPLPPGAAFRALLPRLRGDLRPALGVHRAS